MQTNEHKPPEVDLVALELMLYVGACVAKRVAIYRDQMSDLDTYLNYFLLGIQDGVISSQKNLQEDDEQYYDALEEEDDLNNTIDETLKNHPELEGKTSAEVGRLYELGRKHYERAVVNLAKPNVAKDIPNHILLYPQYNAIILELIANNYLMQLHNSDMVDRYIKIKKMIDASFSSAVGGVKELTFSTGQELGRAIAMGARTVIGDEYMDDFIKGIVPHLIASLQVSRELSKIDSSGLVTMFLPKYIDQVVMGGLLQGMIDSSLHNEPSAVLTLFQSLDYLDWASNANILYNCTSSLCSGMIEDFQKAYSNALTKQEKNATSISTDTANFIGMKPHKTAANVSDYYYLNKSSRLGEDGTPVDVSLAYLKWMALIKATTGVLTKTTYTTSHEVGNLLSKAAAGILKAANPQPHNVNTHENSITGYYLPKY
ncbi:MAG: hypothetical protein ACHP6I_00755 [Rickettsiales bacterium]